MRGKSCSKQGSKADNQKEEGPHLSNAYIRSLVKKFTSSSSSSSNQNQMESENNSDGEGNKNLPPSPPQQNHKKQVRRRLHNSRPYQEKLLNMAEARKEIVTALKSHRAAMKQQQQQQQQQLTDHGGHELQQESHQVQMQILEQEEEGKSSSKSRRNKNQRIYASTSNNNFSSSSCYPPGLGVCPPQNYPYSSWPLMPPPITLPPILQFPENLNLALPYQPLGLNLNYQDFFNGSKNHTIFSSNPPSESSSSSPPLSTDQVGNSHSYYQSQEVVISDPIDMGLHHAVDDKEMEEIRSVGEQHQIEWNDTMNVVSSARWFKFLKSMESEHQEENGTFHDQQLQQQLPFDDEVMDVPSWLQNPNDGTLDDCLCLADYCSDDYMQDDVLPCMEIEEIEGMDGEWLSS